MYEEHRTSPGRGSRRDQTYLDTPIGQAAASYLAIKRKRLTVASERGYEACLAELAHAYPTLVVADFEPPRGTELIEQFLADRWGRSAPRTYNKNLSILTDFFRKQVLRQELHGDPTLAIERAKKVAVYRTVFTLEQKTAIIGAAQDARERVSLKLLLHFGIRKGTLQRVRFGHFNSERRQVSLFTKGNKVQTLPLPHDEIWDDLAAIDDARPEHYLVPKQKLTRRPTQERRAASLRAQIVELQAELADAEDLSEHVRLYPDEQIGEHGLHDLWYRWLARAGIVEEGVTRGARMHGARHTAGQHLLDRTGNLKAVQAMLGHSTINTTGDVYTDWNDAKLADTLLEAIG